MAVTTRCESDESQKSGILSLDSKPAGAKGPSTLRRCSRPNKDWWGEDACKFLPHQKKVQIYRDGSRIIQFLNIIYKIPIFLQERQRTGQVAVFRDYRWFLGKQMTPETISLESGWFQGILFSNECSHRCFKTLVGWRAGVVVPGTPTSPPGVLVWVLASPLLTQFPDNT